MSEVYRGHLTPITTHVPLPPETFCREVIGQGDSTFSVYGKLYIQKYRMEYAADWAQQIVANALIRRGLRV